MNRALLASLLLGAALSARPAFAAPAPRVSWTEVEVRDGDDAPRLAKLLGKQLAAATKRAEWRPKRKPRAEPVALAKSVRSDAAQKPAVPKPPVPLSAKVSRFDWTKAADVVHLDVAAVAKAARASVRTKIRVSGRPGDERKLEKDALRIVADGLVARLAEIVRRR